MFRSRCEQTLVWACVLAMLAGLASAQGVADRAPIDATESFLTDNGLDTLLAVHLRDRLMQATGEDRQRIADRLGEVYARMHASAGTTEQRAEIETLGRELIRLVPDSESYLLRLNLTKSRYLIAEQIAEKHRLRLATEEERAEAQRILRDVASAFEDIANRVQTVIDSLERHERRAIAGTDTSEIRRRLERSRRERSLARYYSGWSRYYRALVEGQPTLATGAATDFGWLLGSPGKPAAVEKASKPMLRYEHIARSAIGCAMAASMLGNDAEAERWFDLIQTAPEVSENVLSQLFTRRLVVYANAKRWADVERLVTRERLRTGAALSAGDARLLAVITLDASQDRSRAAGREAMLASLSQVAFKDLIAHGELGQIVDLVNRYGSTPVGTEGFVAEYVRAIKSYDRAMESHKATGKSAEEPATDEQVLILLRDASTLLRQAAAAPDADAFPSDRDRSLVLAGVALFLAGRFEESADTLERLAASATSDQRREEAMWLAIASLDMGVDSNRPSLAPRRDRLATLYLERFPTTERAARLLIRRASDNLLTDANAADILLAVQANSPLYPSARRYASRLLYRIWRNASGADRLRAARQFRALADELLTIDTEAIAAASVDAAGTLQAELILRERQVLDVVLSSQDPDTERAAMAIRNIESLTGSRDQSDDLAAELLYRRLQLALAAKDDHAFAEASTRLASTGGRFAEAGDRLAYRHALELWRDMPSDEARSRRVVAIGLRLIERIGSDSTRLSDPATFGLCDTVSAAAAHIWRAIGDRSMRDTSISIDRRIYESGLATGQVLRRLAELAEDAGLRSVALEAWRSMLAGYREGTTDWFESRYNSLRLLADDDPEEAARVMAQYAALRPDLGPEPWRTRFELLRARLNEASGAGGGPP